MIYIIEGCDGVGKTVLANAIMGKTKAHILHSNYNSDFNTRNYYKNIWDCAERLTSFNESVIIDRWAISEYIYGTVFRCFPVFDVNKFIKGQTRFHKDIVWIFCRNDDAIENHKINCRLRDEMYEDISEVAKLYDQYILESDINWHVFDYNLNNIKEFVEGLPCQK